jgi:hypothetical protein
MSADHNFPTDRNGSYALKLERSDASVARELQHRATKWRVLF